MSQPRRKAGASSRASSDSKDKQSQLDAFTSGGGANSHLTTSQGVAIPDNHNSLKAGARGPTLMEDFILREKLAHFAHERTAERTVYARGSAAHGTFKVYKPMSQFTSAGFLQDPEAEIPVFVRFSNSMGSRGAVDAARDVRGFAVKFYTAEGNYDLVGSSVPVFYIQDAMKFPDLIHAMRAEPHNDMPQSSSAHDTFWDFASLMPEATHMLMWLMSDRALPRSLRMMEGFGVHSFRFINAQGQSHFVKFHWKPKLGVHGLLWDEAQKIAGRDGDFHRRDLWEAIAAGNFPEWELGVQMVEESKAGDLGFDLLDPTKLIPEEQVPVQLIGRMVLNRNVDNFFAETEQVAFNPGHLVPGIDFSNDPLLQGRLASYTDAQLARLGGPNFNELPINRAVCPVHNFQRDGLHRQTINKGRVSYEPNTLGAGAEFRVDGGAQGFQSYAEEVASPKLRRRSASFDDHFSQATLFWNSQSVAEKDHIVSAFRYELSRVDTQEIRQRVVDNLAHVDMKLATRVAAPLGIGAPDAAAAAGRLGYRDHVSPSRISEAPSLSMAGRAASPIHTRRVAVLATDGVDMIPVRRVIQELTDAGLQCKLVAPRLGQIGTASGRTLPVDFTFSNISSVVFDAVLIPGGSASTDELCRLGLAVHFVLEAYKHCKPICSINEGVALMATLGFSLSTEKDVALTVPTPGVVVADSHKAIEGQISQEFITAIAAHRHWDRVNVEAVPA
ncbi:MAG: catalase [Pseudomonadota bacterium]